MNKYSQNVKVDWDAAEVNQSILYEEQLVSVHHHRDIAIATCNLDFTEESTKQLTYVLFEQHTALELHRVPISITSPRVVMGVPGICRYVSIVMDL